jgi:hypothetical protein
VFARLALRTLLAVRILYYARPQQCSALIYGLRSAQTSFLLRGVPLIEVSSNVQTLARVAYSLQTPLVIPGVPAAQLLCHMFMPVTASWCPTLLDSGETLQNLQVKWLTKYRLTAI